MNTQQIRKNMPVISSCGCRIGTVDLVKRDEIRLTKGDPAAGGEYHFIPLDWVEGVDDRVHLNKDAAETRRDWKEETVGAV